MKSNELIVRVVKENREFLYIFIFPKLSIVNDTNEIWKKNPWFLERELGERARRENDNFCTLLKVFFFWLVKYR